MPRYFMRDTSLAGTEKMMMQIPGYKPRGGGFTIGYRYTASDCDCRYCIKNKERTSHCHGAADCICFDERLAADCWTHGELAGRLVRDAAIPKLTARIRQVLPPQTPTPFQSQEHAQRMTAITAAMNQGSAPYLAAVFLLSADPEMWEKSLGAMTVSTIDFNKIGDLGHGNWILKGAAQDLYRGCFHIPAGVLCDSQSIADDLFRLIISAFVIRRYGLSLNFLDSYPACNVVCCLT